MDFQLVIFDLDGVLTTANLYILHDIIPYWRSRGVKIALASHNGRAPTYLSSLGILSHFDTIVYFFPINSVDPHLYPKNKAHLVATVLTYYPGIPHHEILFFDDSFSNCYEVSKMGVRTCNVNPDIGFNGECINWADGVVGVTAFHTISRKLVKSMYAKRTSKCDKADDKVDDKAGNPEIYGKADDKAGKAGKDGERSKEDLFLYDLGMLIDLETNSDSLPLNLAPLLLYL